LRALCQNTHHENCYEDSCDADADAVESELGWGVARVVEAVLVLVAGLERRRR